MAEGDVLAEAEVIAREAWERDPRLPIGAAWCGYYDLGRLGGRLCGALIGAGEVFCERHMIDAGLVPGVRRCAGRLRDGRFCDNLVRGGGLYCRQHRRQSRT